MKARLEHLVAYIISEVCAYPLMSDLSLAVSRTQPNRINPWVNDWFLFHGQALLAIVERPINHSKRIC